MYQLLASLGARQRVAIALIAAFAAAVFTIHLAGSASAATKHHRGKHRGHVATHTGSATGLGQLSGLLPRNKLTLESAIQVNLSNQTVRLPLIRATRPIPTTRVRPRRFGTSCWSLRCRPRARPRSETC